MDQSSSGTSKTYSKLSSTDKQTLALLKGTPSYEVLVKAVDLYQKDKAYMTMALAPNWDNVVQNRGEILGSKFLIDLIIFTTKEQERAVKAKKAIETLEKAK